jgi:pyrroline-5-carboxylate reductase
MQMLCTFQFKERDNMIGFIGGGNMAEALIKGILRSGKKDIMVSEPRHERRVYLEKTYGVKATSDNKEICANCPLIILAVKPQNMDEVTAEISGILSGDTLIISIAAGITLSYLSARLKTSKIIRVMPNTPALVQEGMSVLSMCECIHDRDMSLVREIFMSVGKVLVLPEKYMDAVTALSGSGPAFFALFAERMIEAGITLGLTPEHASELSLQTLIGTAKLLETGMPPAKLREMVTSPGGTTAAGLQVFTERGFTNLVQAAIEAAARRSAELGRKE